MPDINNMNYTETFPSAMRDPNRKLQAPISLPALTRHIGFRRDEGDFDETLWFEKIERLILALFIALRKATRDSGLPTRISNLRQEPYPKQGQAVGEPKQSQAPIELLRREYEIEFTTPPICRASWIPEGGRYETVVLSAEYEALPITLRFEVFEEYFTVTTTVEFSLPEKQSEIVLSETHLQEMNKVVAHLNRPKRAGKLRPPEESLFTGAVTNLGKKFWEDFDKFMKEAMFEATRLKITNLGESENNPERLGARENAPKPLSERKNAQKPSGDRENAPKLASKSGGDSQPSEESEDDQEPDPEINWNVEAFHDFRGFLFGVTEHGLSRQPHILGLGQPQRSIEERLEPKNYFETNKKKLAHVAMAFPVLLATEKHPRTRPFESSEYTWSTFENDTVLYGSCLGRQIDRDHHVDNSTLSYVLLFEHDDHRAVGRTVGRLHMMGTVRTAALLDFERTMVRDQVLSSLDLELTRIDATKAEADLVSRKRESLKRLAQAVASIPYLLEFRSNWLRIKPKESKKYRDKFRTFAKTLRKLESEEEGRRDASKETLRTCYAGAANRLESLKSETRKLLKRSEDSLGPREAPNFLLAGQRIAWRHIRRECRLIEREMEIICEIKTTNKFKSKNLENVKRSLTSMNDRMKFGVTYRSARSKYHREMFDDLAIAMNVKSVPGFQKYDDFVRHRLYRSYNMMTSTEVKFDSIMIRAREITRRQEDKETKDRLETLKNFQAFGEVALVLVIIPYYVSNLLYKTDIGLPWAIFIAFSLSLSLWYVAHNFLKLVDPIRRRIAKMRQEKDAAS